MSRMNTILILNLHCCSPNISPVLPSTVQVSGGQAVLQPALSAVSSSEKPGKLMSWRQFVSFDSTGGCFPLSFLCSPSLTCSCMFKTCGLLICRGGMIQTSEQYQFLYSTLAQYSSQLQQKQVHSSTLPRLLPVAFSSEPSGLYKCLKTTNRSFKKSSFLIFLL